MGVMLLLDFFVLSVLCYTRYWVIQCLGVRSPLKSIIFSWMIDYTSEREIIDSRGNGIPKNGCEHKFWFVIFIEKK